MRIWKEMKGKLNNYLYNKDFQVEELRGFLMSALANHYKNKEDTVAASAILHAISRELVPNGWANSGTRVHRSWN